MITKRLPDKNRLIAVLALTLILLAADAFAAKQIYMYRDEKGVMHFTDAPTDTRYRPFKVRAKIIIGTGGRRMSPKYLQPYILAAAKKYRLDPALITAVIKVESAFDPMAVSWAGAQGLMQLMPSTAAMMGVQNSFSAKENIYGGSRYLRKMLDRFGGNTTLAVAAYNCGPERVAKVNRIPNIKETQAYVKRVMTYYASYKTGK